MKTTASKLWLAFVLSSAVAIAGIFPTTATALPLDTAFTFSDNNSFGWKTLSPGGTTSFSYTHLLQEGDFYSVDNPGDILNLDVGDVIDVQKGALSLFEFFVTTPGSLTIAAKLNGNDLAQQTFSNDVLSYIWSIEISDPLINNLDDVVTSGWPGKELTFDISVSGEGSVTLLQSQLTGSGIINPDSSTQNNPPVPTPEPTSVLLVIGVIGTTMLELKRKKN